MTVWVDVVARARGLSARLLGPRQLSELGRARDLRDLALKIAVMQSEPVPDGIPEPRKLEESERRRAAAQVRLVARWSGARYPMLAPLFEEEDCRSIRAALRGAIAGSHPDERLVGLIPTPGLPARVLAQLVSSGTASAVAALLVAWGNPWGPVLLAEASRHEPDLFTMEQSIAILRFERATRAATRAGRAMRLYVERQIDAANCWSALLLAEQGCEGHPDSAFLPGGRLVPRDAFVLAAGSRSRSRAAAILAELVRQTPLGAATGRGGGVEERVRRAIAREQHAIGLIEPTGPAPIIEHWLRLRGEVEAVQRCIWSVAMQAPPATRTVD